MSAKYSRVLLLSITSLMMFVTASELDRPALLNPVVFIHCLLDTPLSLFYERPCVHYEVLHRSIQHKVTCTPMRNTHDTHCSVDWMEGSVTYHAPVYTYSHHEYNIWSAAVSHHLPLKVEDDIE